MVVPSAVAGFPHDVRIGRPPPLTPPPPGATKAPHCPPSARILPTRAWSLTGRIAAPARAGSVAPSTSAPATRA